MNNKRIYGKFKIKDFFQTSNGLIWLLDFTDENGEKYSNIKKYSNYKSSENGLKYFLKEMNYLNIEFNDYEEITFFTTINQLLEKTISGFIDSNGIYFDELVKGE